MYIRSRKCARKYSERYDHGHETLIGKIDPGFILQNPSRASISDSHIQSEAWKTKDPEIISPNTVIRELEYRCRTDWTTSYCEFIHPNVRVYPILF